MTDTDPQRIAAVAGCLAAITAGILAYCIAKAAGVPVWRDWEVGDAFDIGLLTGCLTHFVLLAVRNHLKDQAHD